jgi:hypothetical protein
MAKVGHKLPLATDHFPALPLVTELLNIELQSDRPKEAKQSREGLSRQPDLHRDSYVNTGLTTFRLRPKTRLAGF